MSDEALALSTAVTRLVEEHLYFVALYFRWVDDAGWAVVKPVFFRAMPLPLKAFIPAMLRRQVTRALFAQGVGRHSREQLAEMGRSDLSAIATILGDKPFLLGDQPRTVDAVAYGLLANLAFPPVESPLKQTLLGLQPLADYCDRIRARYWADTAAG
jgi:glutathione S-transferase